jgi:hypothetical protein
LLVGSSSMKLHFLNLDMSDSCEVIS